MKKKRIINEINALCPCVFLAQSSHPKEQTVNSVSVELLLREELRQYAGVLLS